MSVFDNLRVAANFAGGLHGADAAEWIERTLAVTGLTRYGGRSPDGCRCWCASATSCARLRCVHACF